MATRPVVTGKIYLLEEIEEKGLEIRGDLMFQGWTKFLEMKELVYPKLVRGLYTAASLKKEDFIIQRNIKGKNVLLMEHHIKTALDMEIPIEQPTMKTTSTMTFPFRKVKL